MKAQNNTKTISCSIDLFIKNASSFRQQKPVTCLQEVCRTGSQDKPLKKN